MKYLTLWAFFAASLGLAGGAVARGGSSGRMTKTSKGDVWNNCALQSGLKFVASTKKWDGTPEAKATQKICMKAAGF